MIEVVGLVLLLCLDRARRNQAMLELVDLTPGLQMKKLKPTEEAALSFHTREALPSGLLPVSNARNLGDVGWP